MSRIPQFSVSGEEYIDNLIEENKRLQSALDYANRDREDMYKKIIEFGNKRESQRNMNYKLRKENKNLNIKVASLEGEIKGLNSVIDKLREENQTLELWLDNKEKLNEKYRKEIEKLRTDNIYEEGLYD